MLWLLGHFECVFCVCEMVVVVIGHTSVVLRPVMERVPSTTVSLVLVRVLMCVCVCVYCFSFPQGGVKLTLSPTEDLEEVSAQLLNKDSLDT